MLRTIFKKEDMTMIDIRDNTVAANDQMRNASSIVSYMGASDAPLRILVLGNSITRHGPKAEIGWERDWGMAASAPEKDYVHLLYAKLCAAGVKAYMMIRQASGWEIGYMSEDILDSFKEERAFGADIVIYRLGENVKKEMKPYFAQKLKPFVEYVAPRGKVIFASCFWKNETVDDAIRTLAAARGEQCVEITCEGEHQTAMGLFAHKGVAMHPGDAGMEMIATRLAAAVLQEVNK
jgi:hypothetical protein